MLVCQYHLPSHALKSLYGYDTCHHQILHCLRPQLSLTQFTMTWCSWATFHTPASQHLSSSGTYLHHGDRFCKVFIVAEKLTEMLVLKLNIDRNLKCRSKAPVHNACWKGPQRSLCHIWWKKVSLLLRHGSNASVDVKFYKVTGTLNVGQGHQVIVNGVRECWGGRLCKVWWWHLS